MSATFWSLLDHRRSRILSSALAVVEVVDQRKETWETPKTPRRKKKNQTKTLRSVAAEDQSFCHPHTPLLHCC